MKLSNFIFRKLDHHFKLFSVQKNKITNLQNITTYTFNYKLKLILTIN